VFSYVLAGVKDAFMINYGSGGIGSEIIANRLGVGPMHDCLTCAYEEFFLTSFTVADPAMLVDVPPTSGWSSARRTTSAQRRARRWPQGELRDRRGGPANISHSYTGDFVKIRNTHAGKEQHVFHLHNHQWLFNPNDDDSNYMDAQGIGPGAGYTYEINFGGSGTGTRRPETRSTIATSTRTSRRDVVPLAAQRHDADRDRPRRLGGPGQRPLRE